MLRDLLVYRALPPASARTPFSRRSMAIKCVVRTRMLISRGDIQDALASGGSSVRSALDVFEPRRTIQQRIVAFDGPTRTTNSPILDLASRPGMISTGP